LSVSTMSRDICLSVSTSSITGWHCPTRPVGPGLAMG
jgi:hypothetical protein